MGAAGLAITGVVAPDAADCSRSLFSHWLVPVLQPSSYLEQCFIHRGPCYVIHQYFLETMKVTAESIACFGAWCW